MSSPKTVCEDCLDTGLLYPDGENGSCRPCPYCEHGIIEAPITYHCNRLVPHDPGTTVYWVSQGNITKDIPQEDIPQGAEIIDETHIT